MPPPRIGDTDGSPGADEIPGALVRPKAAGVLAAAGAVGSEVVGTAALEIVGAAGLDTAMEVVEARGAVAIVGAVTVLVAAGAVATVAVVPAGVAAVDVVVVVVVVAAGIGVVGAPAVAVVVVVEVEPPADDSIVEVLRGVVFSLAGVGATGVREDSELSSVSNRRPCWIASSMTAAVAAAGAFRAGASRKSSRRRFATSIGIVSARGNGALPSAMTTRSCLFKIIGSPIVCPLLSR